MKLVINTQYKENYGAFDWDGKGSCPQYWKFKGGTTYVVENLKPAHVAKIAEKGLPTLKNLLEHSSNYSEEYIINYVIEEDDAEVFDEWETQYFLTYQQDGEGPYGKWVCRGIRRDIGHNDIKDVIESWDLLDGGERTNYYKEYCLYDGTWVTETEYMERLTA